MLRLLVLALVFANAAYFAWSQGFLAAWGAGPAQQSEPQRVAQQLKPEAIRVVAPDEARRIESAPVKAPDCLVAGPLEDAQASVLKQALDAWPAGSWSIAPATEPARWIVYMGKYTNAESLAKKKAELRQIGVTFDTLQNASLEPGLSLGAYPTQAAAQVQLDALTKKGVHTAKVVLEQPEKQGQQLKLPAVDDALRPRLDELKTALGTKPLRACRT